MKNINVVNEYFKQFEEKSNYNKKEQITGVKYTCKNKKDGQILRCILDNQLEASISKVKEDQNYSFKYVDKSDLIIIGLCLQGKKTINYKGKHKMKKGDLLYFRPGEDFNIELKGHSFLYYFIDCYSFEKSLKTRDCHNLFCEFHIDYICKKGEIWIEKAPAIISSYIEEMKALKYIKTNNFLDYAKMKGKLLNYLTWFIGLRLNENPHFEEGACDRHYVAKAKKIIMDNLEEQITVKEISDRLDISLYKLQKSFKEVEDTTVYDYIRRVKINNSKIFLKNPDLLIIDIAQKVGYENPSKYSTSFKEITGYTPSQYRKL